MTLTLRDTRSKIWKAAKGNTELIQQAKDQIAFTNDYDALLKAVRALTKRKPVHIDPAWKERYRKAHMDYQLKEYPAAIRDQQRMMEGRGDWSEEMAFLPTDYPDASTANGLTNIVVRYLTWTGHFANPTANKGTAIEKTAEKFNIHSGKLEKIITGTKYIPSKSKNGMQDIDCNLKHPAHPFGIPWKVEIKAGKDTHKENQKEFGIKVQATGGVYSVVRNPNDFFQQLDRLMQQ